MLLKFYIDDEIHRLTHHDINKNITNQICKCVFNLNEDIWKMRIFILLLWIYIIMA